MPNVAQGVTASYTFTASQIVSFTIDSGEQAVVNITRGGALIANRPIVNNQVIGPYMSGDVMTITALRGAVDYDVSNYSAPTPGGGTVDSASVQAALSSDQAGGRTALGLGTAATQASTAFASNTEVATFADLPAANAVTPGRGYTVLGNITGAAGGAFGTQWVSNGTIWRPAGGQVLWHLTAQVDGVSGGSTAEQILASPLFPASVLAGCRAIALRSRWTASAADTNSRTMRWRVGSAGTTSDAAVMSTVVAAANRVALFPAHLSMAGNTAMLATYYSSISESPDRFVTTTSVPTVATTIPDASSTALYISASVQQGASPTSTVSLERAWIYVE